MPFDGIQQRELVLIVLPFCMQPAADWLLVACNLNWSNEKEDELIEMWANSPCIFDVTLTEYCARKPMQYFCGKTIIWVRMG